MINPSKLQLESAVARTFNRDNRLAYAHVGPDLTILQTSDNFLYLLPAEIETAEGQMLVEVAAELAGAEDQLQAVLRREQEEYLLESVSRETAGGAKQFLNFRVVNLQSPNTAEGLLLIIEDVTTTTTLQRQLRQQRSDLQQAQAKVTAAAVELNQLHQFKSFLLSLLAHDMQTPLAAIRGYAELLIRLLNSAQGEKITTKATSFADNICNITDQMTWLIRDIIDLDQSEKGPLTVKLENCDLHRIIHETIEMMHSIVKLQNITLLLEFDPPDLLISADSQRMRQITNNLIGAAIKHTPNGGEITINTYIKKGRAVLVVADNGKSFTPEQIEKIFQPYYRTREAKSSNILGSGLGLHIVKTLVEAQNGRIEVTRAAGKGNKFTLHLPLA